MAKEEMNTNEGNGDAGIENVASGDYVILSPENLDLNAALPPIIDKNVIAAIKTAIGGDLRVAYDSYESAINTLQEGMEKTNSYAGLPIISYRDEAFDESNLAVISTVGQRVKEVKDAEGKVVTPATNGIRAILIHPVPKLDTFLDSEDGRKWLDKLKEREAADVGFSGIRSAESVGTLANALARMPIDVVSITRESRANAIDTSLFDDNWNDFKDAFTKKNPTFAADGMFPAKPLWLKAIRSKSYAMNHPGTAALEERGLIEKIATLFIKTMKAATDPKTGEALNLDTSVVEGWLADREKLDLSAGAKPDANALDNLALTF